MVIGKGGRHIPIERALDHVAGYTSSSTAACATIRSFR